MKRSTFSKGMFMLWILTVLGWFNPRAGHGQAVLGARPGALGQATTALPASAWSVFENPAMIVDDDAIASFFGIRYYGLPELSDVAAVCSYPTKYGVIAAGAHRYGDDLFSESRLRLAYKNSYQNFYYGMALNYNHVVQGGNYGSFGAFIIDIGIGARVLESLSIAAKATNVNQGAYGRINNIVEEVPRNMSIGLSYQLSGLAMITTDVVKDVQFPISYRAGMEVKVVDNLMARAGIATAPQIFSCGFGYNTSAWGVNAMLQKHEESALGLSPGIDFNIRW